MATHSSVLAWRIPGTVEPGGLPSTGSHRVGHPAYGILLWCTQRDNTGVVPSSYNHAVTIDGSLDNPMDRGAWWAAVYGIAQSRA